MPFSHNVIFLSYWKCGGAESGWLFYSLVLMATPHTSVFCSKTLQTLGASKRKGLMGTNDRQQTNFTNVSIIGYILILITFIITDIYS